MSGELAWLVVKLEPVIINLPTYSLIFIAPPCHAILSLNTESLTATVSWENLSTVKAPPKTAALFSNKQSSIKTLSALTI